MLRRINKTKNRNYLINLNLLSELLIKLDSIFNDANIEPQVKVEQLYKFYQEVVVEELRSVHKKLSDLKMQEELNDYKSEVYDQQKQKAQLVMNKYQVVAKETQNQYKQF